MAVRAVAGLPDLGHASAGGGRGDWPASRVAPVVMAQGSGAGMLLACCDVVGAIVVCLAAGGDDIFILVPVACGRWPGLPGTAAAPSGPGRLAARSARCLPGLVLRCPGSVLAAVPAWPLHGLRRLAALTSSGSQVGSQGGQAPGDARPRPATEAADDRHAGPRPATCGDGRNVYGMQEVRSSSLRSSTFSQVRGHLRRS
jgi:hypothetical protein